MRCYACNLPKGVGRGNVWHSNGAITGKNPPYLRGNYFDVDELNNLFEEFSTSIGYDITRLVIEGKRKDAVQYLDSLFQYMESTGKMLGNRAGIMTSLTRYVPVWGYGKLDIVEYRKGESCAFEIGEPYSIPMFLGQMAGFFEAIEGGRASMEWEGDVGRIRARLSLMEEESDLERRMESQIEASIPFTEGGELDFNFCIECGAPQEIAEDFEWDLIRGVILERRSGKRFILHNAIGMVAVVRLLREELGEEVDGLLMEISRDYARGYYELLKDQSTLDVELRKMAIRGMGRPTSPIRHNQHLMIKIINPFYPSVMAGKAWGLLESFESSALDLEALVEGEGLLELTLKERA